MLIFGLRECGESVLLMCSAGRDPQEISLETYFA